jgi:DNA-binding transcriptional MerR regulator
MFLIGDFSKIARISTRQLRHYDELDLFKPSYVETETGYRYYSAAQLPQLNRILALKDLGLSLKQIKQLIADNISAEQVHGMLTLKKSQVEQALLEDLERMRSVEERIWEIEAEGILSSENVVLKSLPEQKFLSTRQIVPTLEEGFRLIYEIHHLLPSHVGGNLLGYFGVCFHNPTFATENLDIEMGFLLEQPFLETISLSHRRELRTRTLAATQTMATLARVGIYNNSVGHYGALGTWLETHHYAVVGPGWEVFLEPFELGKENEAIVEIRIPVEPIKRDFQKL